MELTEIEIKILEAAKESNAWYFQALIAGAAVMLNRRKKYSGSHDPYTNFMSVARRLDATVDEVFPVYLAIKEARMEVAAGDFDDETTLDTLRDLGNYAFLWYGWKLKEKDQK